MHEDNYQQNRIDLTKGIDPAKSNNSKEYMVCHYWFFNHGFKFQDSVCKGCHDLVMLCLSISDIAIINVKGIAYFCIIHNISKSEEINLLKVLCLKMVGIYKNTYQRNQY